MKYLLLTCLLIQVAIAGPTKVGNGDDGTDLENFFLLTRGKIVNAKRKALKHLKVLNISGVESLGSLIPELENSKLYMTKNNISATKLEELGAFHSGMDRYVYARTFPRPYAPTRFFPITKTLSEKQLISLHIHEALHRALPADFREDEKIVSEITLAITSPGATFDRVQAISRKHLRPDLRSFLPFRAQGPTTVSLAYYKFHAPDDGRENLFNPLDEMYKLTSGFYPFRNKFSTLGFGLDFSFFKAGQDSYMGPLGLRLSMVLWTLKGFDIEAYSVWARDTGSSKEFRNSLSARDSFRVGFNFSKYHEDIFFKHSFEYIKQAEANKTFANVNYNYRYGSITTAKMMALKKINRWEFGSDLKLILTGDFRVQGTGIDIKTGRNTILAVGPIIRWKRKRLQLSLISNFILTSSQETDFNTLGDIAGEGLGQGHLGFEMKYYF